MAPGGPDHPHRRPRLPPLLAISSGGAATPGDLLPWFDELARAGVAALQVREKELDDRDLFDAVRAARQRLGAGVVVVVNRRIDIALAAGADGVHLPSNGLPVAALRRRFPEALIGLSTHHPDEVAAAGAAGADYVTFGPVWPTPSKARFGPPPGLQGLARAARGGPAVYGLGGVTPDGFTALAAAGAAGAAGIRMFHSRETAARAVRASRAAWPAP